MAYDDDGDEGHFADDIASKMSGHHEPDGDEASDNADAHAALAAIKANNAKAFHEAICRIIDKEYTEDK